MNARRDRPVPAGVGIPGSMAGRPRPATATPWRSVCAREKSRQWGWTGGTKGVSGMGVSARQVVGNAGDHLAQRVLALRVVLGGPADTPGKPEQLVERGLAEVGRAPELQRALDGLLRRLVR